VGYEELIKYVRSYRNEHPGASKQQLAAAAASELHLTKHRAVYSSGKYSVRFCETSKSSFSGTVCALRWIKQFDSVPLIVVLARPDRTEFFLANATFIDKVSHTSHRLTIDRIRGSINGSNIIRIYDGIENRPENFDTLFSIHQEFSWRENLERLVETTSGIAGRDTRLVVTEARRAAILKSPELAATLLGNPAYRRLKQELATIVQERLVDILDVAQIDNVNLRGNRIEQLITSGINEHNLADMIRHVGDVELQLEIKTKLMDRASSPKAYNVDKALEVLSRGTTVIAFSFVAIYLASDQVTASTVLVFDRTVLDATRIQFHWAGRNSRGVTQLTGNLAPLFSPSYEEQIDVARAQQFLQKLIDL